MATLAMAAAPQAVNVAVTEETAETIVDEDRPTLPAVRAEVEDVGPPTRMMVFLQPVSGYAINSRFGTRHLTGEVAPRQHAGIDIAAPTGTTVMAAAEGVVTASGYDAGGYGNYVEVRHPNGVRSFYAHLSSIDVRSGAAVEGGERIGRVGSTGYSTGPHLHFEVRRNGAKVNPDNYIGREFAIELKAPVARG